MTLGEYLGAATRKQRQAGVHDCCTFPADWAVACGHDDPMLPFRGSYSNEEEGLYIAKENGGLAALFLIGMSYAGIPELLWPEDEEPPLREGDIAVLSLFGQEAGAIFTGKRWALVADRGIGCASLDPGAVLRAWRP